MLPAPALVWPLTGAGFAMADGFTRTEPSLVTAFETDSGIEKRRLSHPVAPSNLQIQYHCETAGEAGVIDAIWTGSRRGERTILWRHPEFGTNTVARFVGPPMIAPKGVGFVVKVELEADDTLAPAAPFSGTRDWPTTLPAPHRPSASRTRGAGALRAEAGARPMPRLVETGSLETLALTWLCDFDERTAFLNFWRGPAARGARWLSPPPWATSLGLVPTAQTRFSGDLTVTVAAPYFEISVGLEARAGVA